MSGNLRRLFAAAVVCAAATSLSRADEDVRPGNSRPNVLFISIDDLNDWVGVLGGHPDAQTPNIDRLAARGMLFTNAHCAAPLCNPSRTSVMTGLLPTTSGVHGNEQDWRKSPFVAGKATLPRWFKQHGYETLGAGKLFHANHGAECGSLQGGHGGLQGFDDVHAWSERFPARDRQLAKPAVMPGQNFNGLDIWHWDWGPLDVADDATTDGRSVAWAVEQLQQPRDRPFFLAVGIYRPHGPWYVPREYFERFEAGKLRLPEVDADDLIDVPAVAQRYLRNPENMHKLIVDAELWREAVAAYLANIAFADAMVGRLLDALDAGRYSKNTIVCLWSDHGWHLGEKQRWHKSTLWEEATRVPLIVVAPNVTRPGERCDRPVSLIDLFPTLTALCDLPQRPGLDGLSFVPQLRNPDAPRERPVLTTLAGRHHSVRTQRWRYTRYAEGSEELYDHQADPQEWRNLAGDAAFDSVKRELFAWIPKTQNEVPENLRSDAEPGFRPIFNGYDLTSWAGDSEAWSARDGVLVGQAHTTKAHAATLYWAGGLVSDFELRFEYRIPKIEESDRPFVAFRSRVMKHPGGTALVGPRAVLQVGEDNPDGWQRGTIVARGPVVRQELNGAALPRASRPGERGDAAFGVLGLVLPADTTGSIEFRNLRIRTMNRVPSPRLPEYVSGPPASR